MDTTDTTAAGCCRLGHGLHYRSAEWLRLAEAGCWSDCWPEIDRNGLITGRTIGDEPGFLNVADEAMIAVAEARLGRWTIDREEGRASPPEPRYEYTIERDGVTTTPCYQEVAMIEAANFRWEAADDLPDGCEVADLDFGGVMFKVYRQAE
jgi:hypothetical protein